MRLRGPVYVIAFAVIVFVLLQQTKALQGQPLADRKGIDAEINGPVYGDKAGLDRIVKLESQLHQLVIKPEHPRIVLTPELIGIARHRMVVNHPSWAAVKSLADKGDVVYSAFVSLLFLESKPSVAREYALKVYKEIMLPAWNPVKPDRSVYDATLGFDWAYNSLTESERSEIITKLARVADIAGRAAWIRAGNKNWGETFHREEWIGGANSAWPEIALAGHSPDADFCYKSRWRYDFYWGDAARTYAYLNDGTPIEGYQYGFDGAGWFLALKSATGINLIDGVDFRYGAESANYQLYSMDFGLNRNIFHHGVGIGAGGLWTYSDTKANMNWNSKIKMYHAAAAQLVAPKDPFQQWFLTNTLGFNGKYASHWVLFQEGYNNSDKLTTLSAFLFSDPTLPATDPRTATYAQLPFARHFSGGNEVYMRSSWGNDAAIACLRSSPAFTKTSHGDFDVNTFLLYRKGNLAPDSGVYDSHWGQGNYMYYQKNTIAHNDVLIIDPKNPDAPTKLQRAPDPGGVEFVTTRALGVDYRFGKDTVFLHNKKANWGDIIAFETTPDFDYAVGEAAVAYGSRLDEYTRSTLFIRKAGDKAYFIVFDKINSTNPMFKKKWIIHTVGEPNINGNETKSEVPGHIVNYDGDTYIAANTFKNSSLYGKVLLPQNHTLRKVGGDGYQFYVEGTKPKNWSLNGMGFDKKPSNWNTVALDGANGKEWFMGGPLAGTGNELKEIGEWRIELMPNTQEKRDLFLNVLYVGDVNETLSDISLIKSEEGNMTGTYIRDVDIPYIVLFSTAPHGMNEHKNITYTIVPIKGSSLTHVLMNMSPSSSYTVVFPTDNSISNKKFKVFKGDDPARGKVLKSTNQGVLSFKYTP